jgi:hypothetical protein
MRRPSPATLIAIAALFVALGGPARAARLIDGGEIKPGTVTSKQIDDRSLKERDLSQRAVRKLRATPDGSIAAADLAGGAVTTRAIAPGSVLSGSVGDNSLTAADLAPSSVGADEIGDNAVGQAEIRNNGVAALEIADQSIDGGEIIDGGLAARDIARQVGTLQWSVKPLDPDKCEPKSVAIAGVDITGDHVLISPASPWPRDLFYTVNGTHTASEFKLRACNHGLAAIPAATYTFNYAVIDG